MGRDKHEDPKFNRGKSLFSDGTSDDASKWDWGGEDADVLRKLIELVTGRGGAIRFGYSRDGSAGSLGIYYGDSRDTLWIRPGDSSGEIYQRIAAIFEKLPVTGGKAPTIAK